VSEPRSPRDSTPVVRRASSTYDPHRRDQDSAAKRPPPDTLDKLAAWAVKHGALPALGALTIVVAVLYAGIFRGETVGDDLTFHMAESRRLADCIAAGDWDFWNPSANGGFASAYYYQVLPQLASAIPSALFGHHLFWFQLTLFLPQVFAPAAAYRGSRLMGATPWQAVVIAIAVTFISGQSRWGQGADGTFQVGLYTQTWSLTAFPLALGYSVKWLTEGEKLPQALAWATFVFLCHPFGGVSLGIAIAFTVFTRLLTTALWHDRAVKIGILAVLVLAFGANCYLVVKSLLAAKGAKGVVPWWSFIAPFTLIAAAGGRVAWGLLGPQLSFCFSTEDRVAFRNAMRELGRGVILGLCFTLATLPGWLTMFVVDVDGFGGFPHRVSDEVGPGYKELMRWQTSGVILDFNRVTILTWLLPVAIFAGRARFLRWLFAPALLFAALLALGPSLPKTRDDLIAPVRFLGAMQIVLAMGIGASIYSIVVSLWRCPPPLERLFRMVAHTQFRGGITLVVLGAGSMVLNLFVASWLPLLLGLPALGAGFALMIMGARLPLTREELMLVIRTLLAAASAAIIVLVVVWGMQPLSARIHTLRDTQYDEHGKLEDKYSYRRDLFEVIAKLEELPPGGRKQVGPGAENHWWNLLSYVYTARPSLLQMGGGGLQASPNYDFLWSVRDFAKLAYVYDTPYLVFYRTTDKKTVPAGETIHTTAGFEIRHLHAPGLVSPVEVVDILPPGPAKKDTPTRKAAIAWLRSGAPLEDKVHAYAGHGAIGPPPDAKVLRSYRTLSPGDDADIHAELEVTRPSTFVIRESWHPRWRAYIDGKPAKVRRVTPDFPAVDVPPGKHLLQMRFERPWFVHASWLAWPAVPIGAWLVLRRRRKPLEQREPEPESESEQSDAAEPTKSDPA
jgi:hypothetical protein